MPWSSAYYKKHGHILPPDGWDILAKHDAILFGAIGSPDVPDKVTVHDLLLPMRRKFDEYVNLRPAYLFPGVTGPLRDKAPGSIDMLVYRENTEGEYAPIGGRLYEGTANEVAVQAATFTRRGCERIIRAAFEAARKRPRKKLTSITKSNALVYGMVLWDEAAKAVAKDYPDVQFSSLLVDAAAMDFVRKPESFDVIVASNLFGDILTDLSAAVTGSIGLASSANINPERTLSQHVRARAWQRAGHRRPGNRQSAGGHSERCPDARSSEGSEGRRCDSPCGGRRAQRRQDNAARSRRQGENGGTRRTRCWRRLGELGVMALSEKDSNYARFRRQDRPRCPIEPGKPPRSFAWRVSGTCGRLRFHARQ